MVVALMALVLMGALAASLAVIANTEMLVAGNYALAQEAIYAAEAGLEIVSQELAAVPDWDEVAAGPGLSAFVDGPPGGDRELIDGSLLNLTAITAGLENRGWRLFAFGHLSRLQDPGARRSMTYVIVWLADDPAGDPAVLEVRAEAHGPGGTRRGIEATISQAGPLLSWNHVR